LTLAEKAECPLRYDTRGSYDMLPGQYDDRKSMLGYTPTTNRTKGACMKYLVRAHPSSPSAAASPVPRSATC
jgi:hypothetical protein